MKTLFTILACLLAGVLIAAVGGALLILACAEILRLDDEENARLLD